jgi:hypothetical protein
MDITRRLRRFLGHREVVVTLDDVLPMYGEGDTREEAIADLIWSLISLRAMLDEDPTRLSPQLREELDFLRRLMEPQPPYSVTVTSSPSHWTTNSSQEAV